MKVVSGVLYTKNVHAAQQFRTMFWDWLTEQHTDVEKYFETPNDPCYIFYFQWVPQTKFALYRRLWIDPDAVYPRLAWGTFSRREYFSGRNLDPYFVDALKFAKQNAPCLIVVESVAALEMAFDHMRLCGSAHVAKAGLPGPSIRDAIQDFDQDEHRQSYLIVTKALATHGWRLSRPGISLAASCLLTAQEAEQILGRTARVSQPHGRIEVVSPAKQFLHRKEK